MLSSTNDNGTIERIRSGMKRDNVKAMSCVWNEHGYHNASFCDRRVLVTIVSATNVMDQPLDRRMCLVSHGCKSQSVICCSFSFFLSKKITLPSAFN